MSKPHRYFSFVIGLALTSLCPALSYATITIDWEIGNRFRTFDYSNGEEFNNTERSTELFTRFSPAPITITPETAPGFLTSWLEHVKQEGGSPYANDSMSWIEDESRNKPRYADNFTELPRYIYLKARLTGEDSDRNTYKDSICSWRLDDKEIKQQSCTTDEIHIPQLPSSGGTLSVWAENTSLASAEVKPKLRIILGLGDSYASGEGTPDRPIRWNKNFTTRLNTPSWVSLTPSQINQYVESPAYWWSNRCDRSFYSHQNLVALQMAANLKHSVVSFIHLACSGAGIIDGLLAPQRRPPGLEGKTCNSSFGTDHTTPDPACDVQDSQLAAATKLLCRTSVASSDRNNKLLRNIRDTVGKLKHIKDTESDQSKWIRQDDITPCPQGQMRNTELILLSIGGNDIGFGGVVAGTLLPSRSSLGQWGDWIVAMGRKEASVVCPQHTREEIQKGHCKKGDFADLRIKELPDRYRALNLAMQHLFSSLPSDKSPRNFPPALLLLNQYPNSLMGPDKDFCSNPKVVKKNLQKPNEWTAAHIKLPTLLHPHPEAPWQFNVLHEEANVVLKNVIKPLNAMISKTTSALPQNEQRTLQWDTVSLENTMPNNGWCADRGEAQDALKVSPPNWDPYSKTNRFIRTTNDSFLTQWPSNINEDWRRNGLNGTFHPNAYGYAAMAEGVLKAVAAKDYSKD